MKRLRVSRFRRVRTRAGAVSRPSGMFLVVVLLVLIPALPCSARRAPDSDALLVQSGPAERLREVVRTSAQGTLVALFVKPGEKVRRGQLLGHLDLEETRWKRDLARQAFESKAAVEAAKRNAEAWRISREEARLAVRKREAERTRLEWATAMEAVHQAHYEAALETKDQQRIQFEHWQSQYAKRFLYAPTDGVVSDIRVEPGTKLTEAAMVLTISDDDAYSVPLSVPSAVADAARPGSVVSVRAPDRKSVGRARIERVSSDPRDAGSRIVHLSLRSSELPSAARSRIAGFRFEVLLPHPPAVAGR